MRLFFALEAGKQISDQVWRIIGGSPLRRAPWKWILPENYHFTLKFLGEVDPGLAGPLREAARAAGSSVKPFTLKMGAIGGFPKLEKPRVIFYGIEEGFGSLRDLAGRIDEECADIGFAREKREFKAHLTLARVKRPVSDDVIDLLREFPPLGESAVLEADHFILMKSTLTPSGAVYEETGRFELGG
jgi:2'-5' RNA ligase